MLPTMILTCPQCATRYEADAAKFAPPGRKVRCAKCGHVWHQEAPADEHAPVVEAFPPEPQPEPAPQRAAFVAPSFAPNLAATREPPPRAAPSRWLSALGQAVGWIGLVGVILVIAWSALTWRHQVATLWPRTASFYATLGLTVNPVGLGFSDVNHWQQTQDGQSVLTIAGKLVNVSTRDVVVPPIEVTLTDAAKHAVRQWNFAASVATLHPGQSAPFLTRLSSPPPSTRHLELSFAGK
jgi:predicted Zn finger-like uncharacterized protein